MEPNLNSVIATSNVIPATLAKFFMGRNFFSLYVYYNKKPYQRQGACDTYLPVFSYDIPLKIPIKNKACITQTKGKPYLFNHFLKTPILVKMYSARTVQKTTSNPMLFMIFYWRKFFYLINI